MSEVVVNNFSLSEQTGESYQVENSQDERVKNPPTEQVEKPPTEQVENPPTEQVEKTPVEPLKLHNESSELWDDNKIPTGDELYDFLERYEAHLNRQFGVTMKVTNEATGEWYWGDLELLAHMYRFHIWNKEKDKTIRELRRKYEATDEFKRWKEMQGKGRAKIAVDWEIYDLMKQRGMKQIEIANILGLSVSTLRKRVKEREKAKHEERTEI